MPKRSLVLLALFTAIVLLMVLSLAHPTPAVQAQTHFLNNVLTTLQTDAANGFLPIFDGSVNSQIMETLAPVKCACNECESALSPLAYLTDLFKYALGRLQKPQQNDRRAAEA